MAFDGTEGEIIALGTATRWAANYKVAANVARAQFFGRDIINSILAQSGCMGIRIYYAIDDAGEKHLILVGADRDGADQVDGIVADLGDLCPPNCHQESPLNG